MIVRISSEGQYEMDDDHAERLNQIDNAIVDAVGAGNEETFRRLFDEMLGLIRDKGRELGDDELNDSDVIVPPPDLTMEEAGQEFSGEGLIPG
jgi:hypothetical protein